MSPAKERLNRYKEQMRAITDNLGSIHRELRELAKQVEALEKEAQQDNMPRVEYALRDVYVKISNAGKSLVEAHLDAGIPPTVFEQGEETAESK